MKTTLSPYKNALRLSEQQTVPKMSDGTLPFVEKAMEYARDDSQFLLPAIALELKRAAKKVKFPSQNVQRPTFEPQA